MCTPLKDDDMTAEIRKRLLDMTDEEAAKAAAGNWKDSGGLQHFVWFRASELKHPERWMISNYSARDGGLIEQSNASVIENTMRRFTTGRHPTAVFERFSDDLFGHRNALSILVYTDKGKLTKAFLTYLELHRQLENYPLLDETDYSQREYDATCENIQDGEHGCLDEYDLPEDWVEQVYSWFSDNDDRAIENTDDTGGYPSPAQLLAAVEGLKYRKFTDPPIPIGEEDWRKVPDPNQLPLFERGKVTPH